MESLMENAPLILAILLGLSETIALIPSLKDNSILQLSLRLLRKAKELMNSKKLEEKKEDDK